MSHSRHMKLALILLMRQNVYEITVILKPLNPQSSQLSQRTTLYSILSYLNNAFAVYSTTDYRYDDEKQEDNNTDWNWPLPSRNIVLGFFQCHRGCHDAISCNCMFSSRLSVEKLIRPIELPLHYLPVAKFRKDVLHNCGHKYCPK